MPPLGDPLCHLSACPPSPRAVASRPEARRARSRGDSWDADVPAVRRLRPLGADAGHQAPRQAARGGAPGHACTHHTRLRMGEPSAVLMWKGFEEALGRYGFACCRAWTDLGFGDTCAATIATDLGAAGIVTVRAQSELAVAGALPPWLGNEELHLSHRSALVRKDPDALPAGLPRRPGRPALRVAGPVAAVVAAEQRKAENVVDDRNARSSGSASRPNVRIAGAAALRRRRGDPPTQGRATPAGTCWRRMMRRGPVVARLRLPGGGARTP